MVDPQTDWESCGQRRSRAQRLAGVVASREQERQEELNHRRCRLRELLEGEEERWQAERNCRMTVLQARQHIERQEAIDNHQSQQMEHRLRQVKLADEQRERERNHQYREQYWQEVQRYINQTRPLDIALRDHMRDNFGIKKSAGRSVAEQATTYF